MDYSKFIVDKIKRMGESQTIAISEKAKQLKKQGVDVISFATGEPDFDTPDNIKEKAIASIRAGHTKYTAVAGIDELKAAVCAKLKRDNHLDYTPDQVLVSCGAKHTMYNISQVLFDAGDEVIIFAPYWVTYPAQVQLAGAVPVFIDTTKSSDLTLSGDDLQNAITDRTKAIILCSPSNPSGKVYRQKELEIVARSAIENDLIIIADEIYEKLVFDDFKFLSIAALGEDVKERTITVNGVAKAFAMTGWRIGYAAGPRQIIDAMRKIQGQATSNPNSIAQHAAVEALLEGSASTERMRKEFQRRRDVMVESLNAIEGFSCRKPEGAFYAFPRVSPLYSRAFGDRIIKNSVDLCSYLLDEAHAALVPGAAFGCDEYVRLSFATDLESIKTGLERIKQAVEKLNA
ncbi:MAG: pyridoxal phosphate-dependent aminotransferase [Desulfobacterales bacterium]|nr:MAG: pyridoxal phosphate-dependent aminotransferase [Desulfobacterales bacterium]